MREGGDLDVLVVVPDSVAKKEGWEMDFRSFRRFGVPTDLLGLNEGVLGKYGEAPSLVYEQALHHGKAFQRHGARKPYP